MRHHAWLIFVLLVETGFHHVGWADLDLLTSNDPPAFASPSAGITDVSHCTWPVLLDLSFVKFHFLKKVSNLYLPSSPFQSPPFEARCGGSHL